ncbi:MAG TPA: S53 family peptidase [Bryobacteraceae bacterium]|nr:S53 family peptidase [Bryobacteraceae bacterium]
MSTDKVTLPGSERHPLGSRVGDQPNDELIEVSVILKPKARAVVPRGGGAAVSREEFAAKHGADQSAIDKLKQFAKDNNLTVGEVSMERRTVKLEGTAANMMRAFEIKLDRYQNEGHVYRARTGGIQLPSDLAPSVEAVLGLDDRAQSKPHFRLRGPRAAHASSAASVSYTPLQVAQLYQFPADVDGTGETVGILELGGGYQAANLQNYFSSLGVQEPDVVSVSVDKGKNAPTNSNSADGEVQLDIEVVGAVAPGAKIVVYFAPNTSQGFQDALTTAIHDAANKPSVISISWGSAESTWTAQAMTAFDSAAQDAAALGVTICAASGDSGSSDGVSDGANHVDFPASSPHILACGGTSLQSANGEITSETVWNDGEQGGAGGGGFSTQFPLPAWQASANINPPQGGGRGVPDVSGDADPETGYNVLVDGDSLVIGGTSAVAPLWSGLIALLNQKLGSPVGFLQPAIYALPQSANAFNDITSGTNGSFSAGPGWDAASGLGSPSGENLLQALTPKT